MKRFDYCAMLIAVAMGLTSALAAPPDCDTTYNQDDPLRPFWKDPTNWDHGPPDADDVACITNNNTAWIYYRGFGEPLAVAKAIYIESGSEVIIYDDESLSLCTGAEACIDSQVDGELAVYGQADTATTPDSNLFLGDDVTIVGSGVIELENRTGGPGVIAGESGVTLTIASGITLIGTQGLSSSDENGDVRVPLVNNGTVIAEEGILRIQEGGSGTGTWAAETSDGLLIIEDEVTGNSSWELIDDTGAEIRFDSHNRCLTGDVEIRKGTWHANQYKVFTTGDLTMAPPGVIKLTGTGSTASAATRVKFSKTVWGGCP